MSNPVKHYINTAFVICMVIVASIGWTACEDVEVETMEREELAVESESSELLDLGFTVLYADTGYRGFAAHAYEGQCYGSLGTLANKASSLRSYTDHFTCLYKQHSCEGTCICIAPDERVPNLGDIGDGTWNNATVSIHVRPDAPKRCDRHP